jgi:hypothetical protein
LLLYLYVYVYIKNTYIQFVEKPKFGTVQTRGGFGPGDPGLIPDESDSKLAEAPDWDKKLNYVQKGMNRKTIKIAITNDD